ncbi:MBL fold metallo-hydrolase [Sphingomonas immobilis]|uniref:MBL fold metallo-hydrolase n=1 Tax=Sphingomonas immobilis TaxID=3063997 RepID=A0ABT8ZY69_9SPHN|nr:MBL fold metallo-hydrolase [Sphingomonas sp. CA1-15]MDO7841716.1 MBL fold metallo-hydrolase [Sphingomonas sp. CA1-15]
MAFLATIGDVRITAVSEIEAVLPVGVLFPGASATELAAIDWLGEPFATAAGEIRLAIQAFVVETPRLRILIDTCLGNDKHRASGFGHMLKTDFLERLAAAGYPRERIDVVLCTHLHTDHAGWNTMLVDGRWVPTFPHARYLFGRAEFEYWQQAQNGDDAAMFQDSIQPIVDAGLVDLVEVDHRIDTGIRLTPTHGHTPGHVSVVIEGLEASTQAFITGDAFHSPAQVARPGWGAFVDHDSQLSGATRVRLLDELGDSGVRVFGTHFPAPICGTIVREGDGYRFLS